MNRFVKRKKDQKPIVLFFLERKSGKKDRKNTVIQFIERKNRINENKHF